MVAELTGIPVATSVPGRSVSRPSRILGCSTGCSSSSSSSTTNEQFEGDSAGKNRNRKRPRWIRAATREPIYSVLDHRENSGCLNRVAASPKAIRRGGTFEYEISAVRNGEASLDHEPPPIYRRSSEEIGSSEFREEEEEEEEDDSEEEHALYSVVRKPPKKVFLGEATKLPILEEEESNDPKEEISKKQKELHKWLQSASGQEGDSGKESQNLGGKKLPISNEKEANDFREEILKKQRELHKWLKSINSQGGDLGKETEDLGGKKLPISNEKEANDFREEILKKQRELHKWLKSTSDQRGDLGKETKGLGGKKFKMNSEDSLEEMNQRREEMESQKGEDTWSSPGVSVPRGVVGMVGPFCRIYQNPNERREYMLKEEVKERGVDIGDTAESENIYHRMDDEYEEEAVDTASESTFVGDSNKIIKRDYEVDEDSLVAEQQQYRRRAKWRIVDEGEGRECVVHDIDKEEEDEKKSMKNREWSKDHDHDDDGRLGHIETKENYDLEVPPKYTSRRSVASNEPHDKDSLNETGSTTGGTVEGKHSANPARGERSGGTSDPVTTNADNRRPIPTAAPPRSLVSRILARTRSPDDLLDHSEPYSQLWIVLSNVYGELVVVLMMALCLAEVMDTPVPLLSLQSIYLMYLYIGSIAVIISIYLWVLVDSCGSLANGNSGAEDAELGASLTRFGSLKRAHISRARTAPTSFYIRVGALLFGLATLVFNGLEMAMHSMMQGAECLSDVVFVHPVLHGLFTFLQMHFLFVNSQVLVERFGLAARFGFTHLAATNIAVWARLVIWDSAQEWTYFVHLAQRDPQTSSSPLNLRGFPGSLTRRARDLLGRASSDGVIFHPYQPISDEQISQVVTLQECLNTNTLGQLWTSSMPFLYPFIVQFSLIAAAVTYVMGQNVGRNRYCHKQKFHSSKDLTSHMRVGCDGSSKGLFLGILCMTAGIVVILIFLVVREDENFSPSTLSWLTCGTLIGILALSGVMTASGLVQVRQMSIVSRAPSALDGILSNVALFGVQLYSVFTAVVCACSLATFDAETEDADSQGRHAMLLAVSVLQLIQCFAQSTLIAETSKRSCITRFQMMAKPARQVITFLLFSNAVLWAFDTVVTQNWVSQQLQLRFFGVLAWGIVSRICLPLVVFYRFHSCVLLLEAWNKCYRTPRGEHPLN